MECGRNGELVPSGKCADPGLPCPFVHCEVPVTVEPPIIIDPPGENMNVIVSLYKSFQFTSERILKRNKLNIYPAFQYSAAKPSLLSVKHVKLA